MTTEANWRKVWWQPGEAVRAIWEASGVKLRIRYPCWGLHVKGARKGSQWLLVGPAGRLVGAPNVAVSAASDSKADTWLKEWRACGGVVSKTKVAMARAQEILGLPATPTTPTPHQLAGRSVSCPTNKR